VAIWIEEGSRGLAHVAMEDFPTFADALFEIADNPLDYRHGRHLNIDITIDKSHDLIVVEDTGGEGMDADGVADWLKWGTGHPHERTDIGQFHKGGKAACGYLADSVVILTRRAGRQDVWRFEDRHWHSRSDWKVFGEPVPYEETIPGHLAALPVDVGFTRLELRDLYDRRYNVEKLRWRLGNTYRRLISNGSVTFRLNGQLVEGLDLPESSAFRRRDDDIRLPSGRRVHTWVARLDRDALRGGPEHVRGGLRLLFQGRLISEGEYFGHNLGGQGQLASLIGEVDLNHVDPLSNKTGFKKATPEWEEVDSALNQWLAPIIIEFRRAAEEQPISREERKRVNEVRREITEALKRMRADQGTDRDKATADAIGDARDEERHARRPSPAAGRAHGGAGGRGRRPRTPRSPATQGRRSSADRACRSRPERSVGGRAQRRHDREGSDQSGLPAVHRAQGTRGVPGRDGARRAAHAGSRREDAGRGIRRAAEPVPGSVVEGVPGGRGLTRGATEKHLTDQQVQGLLWQLAQKVEELESKLRRIETIVSNIDANAAQTANMVREILRRK